LQSDQYDGIGENGGIAVDRETKLATNKLMNTAELWSVDFEVTLSTVFCEPLSSSTD